MTHAVKHLEKLKRCITISLPRKDVAKAVRTHLDKLNKRIRIDGFRPGKVPMPILQQRYGEESTFKVVQDLSSKYFFDVVKQDSIRLAGTPVLDWPKEKDAEQGQEPEKEADDTNYAVDIQFEVFPDIQFGDFSDCAVTRRTTTIGDAEVDRALEIARHKRGHYHERGSESEHGDAGGQLEVQMGDRVTVELINHWEAQAEESAESAQKEEAQETSSEGQPESAAENEANAEQRGHQPQTRTFILGLEAIFPELETAIVGMKKSDVKTFDLTLPVDYFDPKWAGQAVRQTVTVKTVEWAHLPELNDEFLKSENFENLEALRAAQQKALETEAENRTKALLRTEVIEYLLNATQCDVPESLIREEQYVQFEQMFRRIFPDAQKLTSEEIRQRHNLPADFMYDTAIRRAKTGLIFSELIRQHALTAQKEQLDAQFQTFANEQSLPVEDVQRFFMGSGEHLNGLKAYISEQNAINFVLEKAQIKEESVSFKTLAEASTSVMNRM